MKRLGNFRDITHHLFDEVKAKHQHHWTFLGGVKDGQRGQPPKRVQCRCELCETEHWIIWRHINEGTSMRCRGCAKRLAPNEIADWNKTFLLDGMHWELTGGCRTEKGHRQYYAVCLLCKQGKWHGWSTLQQKRTHACARCAQTKNKTDYIKRSPEEKDLRSKWAKIKSAHKTYGTRNSFGSFAKFRAWAQNNGYYLGAWLVRRKREESYSESNCYWSDRTVRSMSAKERRGFINQQKFQVIKKHREEQNGPALPPGKLTVSTSLELVPELQAPAAHSLPLPILTPGISNQ